MKRKHNRPTPNGPYATLRRLVDLTKRLAGELNVLRREHDALKQAHRQLAKRLDAPNRGQ